MRDGSEHIRDPLTWGFFGGGIETEESSIEAGIREVKEELDFNLEAADIRIVGDAQVREDKIVHAIKVDKHLTWEEFTIHEGAGAAFFTREELNRINLSQTAKIVIEQLL